MNSKFIVLALFFSIQSVVPMQGYALALGELFLDSQPNGSIQLNTSISDGTGKTRVKQYSARFTAQGKLDPSFGTVGQIAIQIHGNAEDLWTRSSLALEEGKILLITQQKGDTFTLIRLNKNGTLDSNFGQTGMVHIRIPNLVFSPTTAVSVKDGFIIAGRGQSIYDSAWAIKTDKEGKLDPNFGASGCALLPSPPAHSQPTPRFYPIRDMQTDGQGRVAILMDGPVVVRLLPNGQLDTGFGELGMGDPKIDRCYDSGHRCWASRFAYASHGKLFIPYGVYNELAPASLLVLESEGTVDIEMTIKGKESLAPFTWVGAVISHYSKTSFLIAGNEKDSDLNSYFSAAEVNDQGKIIKEFDRVGQIENQGPLPFDFFSHVNSAHRMSDGHIVVGLLYRPVRGNLVIAYTPDGKIDPAFGEKGFLKLDQTNTGPLTLIEIPATQRKNSNSNN